MISEKGNSENNESFCSRNSTRTQYDYKLPQILRRHVQNLHSIDFICNSCSYFSQEERKKLIEECQTKRHAARARKKLRDKCQKQHQVNDFSLNKSKF